MKDQTNNFIDKFFRTKRFGYYIGIMTVIGLTLALVYKRIEGTPWEQYHDIMVQVYGIIFIIVALTGIIRPLFYKKPKKWL